MEKYDRVRAEIDLSAIRHNIEEMKQCIRPSTKLLAVIKADAYGHGATMVARELADIVDYYAIAIVEEAVVLREQGIQNPLLILGYTSPVQYSMLLEYNVTATIYNYEDALQLSKLACSQNKIAKIHIKIDTGMSRIGFLCDDESVFTIQKIAQLPGLELEGIFTHFAKADEKSKDAMRLQLERFHEIIDKLAKVGVTFIIQHAANSAATMEEGDLGLDMVRSGISTYGMYPSDQVDHTKIHLIPAMQLRSDVVHLKWIPEGVGIGYGWSYVTKKRTRVATIPVGYADGYKRALSNKGKVLIRGQYAPIIGRVCMDQFMVDVTDIPDVMIGDLVTLVGTDGGNTITVEEVANPCASFNYEFVCGISQRVPRVYYKNGIRLDDK